MDGESFGDGNRSQHPICIATRGIQVDKNRIENSAVARRALLLFAFRQSQQQQEEMTTRVLIFSSRRAVANKLLSATIANCYRGTQSSRALVDCASNQDDHRRFVRFPIYRRAREGGSPERKPNRLP